MEEEYEYIRAIGDFCYYNAGKILHRTGCVKTIKDGNSSYKLIQVAVHKGVWFWKHVKYVWVDEKDIVKYKSEVTCTQVN